MNKVDPTGLAGLACDKSMFCNWGMSENKDKRGDKQRKAEGLQDETMKSHGEWSPKAIKAFVLWDKAAKEGGKEAAVEIGLVALTCGSGNIINRSRFLV